MSLPLIEEIVQLTCDLIQYESIEHRPSEIAAVIDYTEQYARQIPGVIIERVESVGVPNLVVALGSGRNPKLILNAHLDVVPARPEQFKPVVRDGRIYGRGSQDMKGSGAVLLRLLKDLAALPQPPDVAFQFVGDEEIGGMNGTRVLLEERGWQSSFFLAAEPTDLQICYAHKGAMWPKVHIPGKPSHGSRPWEGQNPLAALSAAFAMIEEHYPSPDEPAWVTTVTPTLVNSGDANNRLPSGADLCFDIRFVPEDDPEQVLQVLRNAFPTGDVICHAPNPPLYTDPNNQLVQLLANDIQAATKAKTGFFREHFATDARFYSSAGIPAVCLGPIGAGLHSDEEWVDIESLATLYTILRNYALHE